MSGTEGAKEIWFEKEYNDPKNWITGKCFYCGANVQLNLKFDKTEPEAIYCADCKQKLFAGGGN
jgi:DNA-directed RNA polymerase subunit RPC12/RpoP